MKMRIILVTRCRVCDFAKFPVEFVNEKCSREMFLWRFFCLLIFMENLFLVYQQLVIVLVASIRLLWIFEI